MPSANERGQKEWAGAALTARPEVDFLGENNMDKRTEQTAMTQGRRRSCIPATLPRLVVGAQGTFLVYSGLRIPATAEQAQRHLVCLQQHLQEVARAS
ncbi:hypothetical protein [Aeromonas media]|nr:hypothetical protein [Aeromonas media]